MTLGTAAPLQREQQRQTDLSFQSCGCCLMGRCLVGFYYNTMPLYLLLCYLSLLVFMSPEVLISPLVKQVTDTETADSLLQ